MNAMPGSPRRRRSAPGPSTDGAGVCYLFGLKDDVPAISIPFMRRSVGKLMFIQSRSLSFLLLLFLLTSSRLARQPGVGPDPQEP